MRRLGIILFLAVLGCDSGPGQRDVQAPTLLTPEQDAFTADAVEFRWNSASGATWRFQLAGDAAFNDVAFDTTGLRVPQQVVRGLVMDRTYHWRVAVLDPGGEVWSAARLLHVDRAAVRPGRVQPVFPENGAEHQPITTAVSWLPEPDATAYHLQVALDDRLLIIVVDLDNLRDTRFAIRGLVHTYPYWWRVRAVNAAGAGPWSSVWTFVIERGA